MRFYTELYTHILRRHLASGIFLQLVKKTGNFFLQYVSSSPWLVAYYLGTRNYSEKWIKGKISKDFLHFLPNVCHIFLMNFQSCTGHTPRGTLQFEKNHQIWQKLKKILVQLAFNPFNSIELSKPKIRFSGTRKRH